jgi:ribonucleoside-diphosphate reductase alpha chain
MCLQYGVSVTTLIDKFTHSRFEPSGFSKNPDIPYAKSLVDYIFRWLALTFPNGKNEALMEWQPDKSNGKPPPAGPPPATELKTAVAYSAGTASTGNPGSEDMLYQQGTIDPGDAPVCDQCGAITVRNGSCYRCFVCGSSMGCS